MKNLMIRFPPQAHPDFPNIKGHVTRYMGGKYVPEFPHASAESTLAVLLANKAIGGPTDWECEIMAEQILLHHNIANDFMPEDDSTSKDDMSFLEYCMLNDSPEMLRIFLENCANVESLSNKERVWSLTLYRNNPGILQVLKDHKIDLSHEIRADYKGSRNEHQDLQETLLPFLIMSATLICRVRLLWQHFRKASTSLPKTVRHLPRTLPKSLSPLLNPI
jgi:hypothetical protein